MRAAVKRNENGFTLLELLIAIAVGMLIMLAVYGAMEMAQRSSVTVTNKVITQQDARAVLDLMALEIRMASYNPRQAAATWGTIPVCAQMGIGAPVAARKGIQLANRNTLVVVMDLNNSGVIGDASNEYLMYSYDGASTISRNVSCGGNQAIFGGTGTSSNVTNAAAGLFLFRYFDRLDNDITAAVEASQAQIANIRRVLITIVADTEQNDPNLQQPRRMIYSTNVIVRNHALSP